MKNQHKLQKEYGTEEQAAALKAAQDVAQDRFWQEVGARLERRHRNKEKAPQRLVQARPKARG